MRVIPQCARPEYDEHGEKTGYKVQAAALMYMLYYKYKLSPHELKPIYNGITGDGPFSLSKTVIQGITLAHTSVGWTKEEVDRIVGRVKYDTMHRCNGIFNHVFIGKRNAARKAVSEQDAKMVRKIWKHTLGMIEALHEKAGYGREHAHTKDRAEKMGVDFMCPKKRCTTRLHPYEAVRIEVAMINYKAPFTGVDDIMNHKGVDVESDGDYQLHENQDDDDYDRSRAKREGIGLAKTRNGIRAVMLLYSVYNPVKILFITCQGPNHPPYNMGSMFARMRRILDAVSRVSSWCNLINLNLFEPVARMDAEIKDNNLFGVELDRQEKISEDELIEFAKAMSKMISADLQDWYNSDHWCKATDCARKCFFGAAVHAVVGDVRVNEDSKEETFEQRDKVNS